MPAIDCAGTAFTFYIVMAMFGFNLIATDIATNSIFDYHLVSSSGVDRTEVGYNWSI